MSTVATPRHARSHGPAAHKAWGNEMLRVADLHAFYGESHVLHGIDLHVDEGELITLLGRNGSGRSTTLKAVMGLVGRRSGSVMFNGRELVGMAPHRVARLGVGFCPEERGIFSGAIAVKDIPDAWNQTFEQYLGLKVPDDRRTTKFLSLKW